MWLNDRLVIEAALAVAEDLGDDPNHTVAAAAMDLKGGIYAGVNNYHFTGGPCAELVVLGMAATTGAGSLATMVAVGDAGRGVIAPCGRCRQTILDQHPDCNVLVPGASATDEPESVPVRALLPYAYHFPDAGPERFARFNGRYFDDVGAGRKTQTVRYRDPIPVGPITFVFEDPDRRGFRLLPGIVDSVNSIPFSSLDLDYQAGVRGHYPGLHDDAAVDDVRFHLREEP